MKRILAISISILAFLCAGSGVLAVEKVEKGKGSVQPQKTTPPSRPIMPVAPTKPNAPVTPPTPPTQPKKPEPPKKKFDDFIDKNHNGIDDRKEKPNK